MRLLTGMLYVIAAIFMGYSAFLSMMQTVSGATTSWLDPGALASAIVLLMAGIKAFAPGFPIYGLLSSRRACLLRSAPS